ncbi:MAG: diaminopimelate epimerase [Bacteroidales bacterium]|nr:diaminopimelate epimerase [Bacteroidales bacterium]
MKFYKYQGAGNDFLIADNRDGAISLTAEQIAALCDRRYGIGADGLMLLEASDTYDFRMNYYNSDGSGGMMCGNGGRCMVAFAADMGITHFDFEAADGFHTAQILTAEDCVKTVRLKMKDVSEIIRFDVLEGPSVPSKGCFLDTGTRHYIRFVEGLEDYDVVNEGRDIRYNAAELKPIGANVNFVEPYDGGIKVRTYEKGVEDETFACGTGIVAASVASYYEGIKPSFEENGRVRYDVKAKRDFLAVDFRPAEVASDVWLIGPAAFVAEIILPD